MASSELVHLPQEEAIVHIGAGVVMCLIAGMHYTPHRAEHSIRVSNREVLQEAHPLWSMCTSQVYPRSRGNGAPPLCGPQVRDPPVQQASTSAEGGPEAAVNGWRGKRTQSLRQLSVGPRGEVGNVDAAG